MKYKVDDDEMQTIKAIGEDSTEKEEIRNERLMALLFLQLLVGFSWFVFHHEWSTALLFLPPLAGYSWFVFQLFSRWKKKISERRMGEQSPCKKKTEKERER